MYKLIIEDDEGKTTVVPLIRDEITIGRKEGNTIRLTERNVSRKHAKLVKQNGSVYIEDLTSYNGIKVNGDRISGRAPVQEGDRIQIGDYQLALKLDKATQPNSPAGEVGNEKTTPFVRENGATPGAPMDLQPTVQTAILQAPVLPPSETPARLAVVSSNFAGQEFVLEKPAMVIGRTDENDIVVNHRSISRHHAKIIREGAHFHIVDLQSANGVRVNGEEYGKVELRKGDHVDLGHVRLRFVAPGEDFVFDRDAQIVDVAGTGRSKAGLMAVLAIGLIILVAGGIALVKLMGKGGDQGGAVKSGDTEGQVARLLLEADKSMKNEDWGGAVGKCDEALKLDPSQELARDKRQKAEAEKKNLAAYNSFIQSAEKSDFDSAVASWGEVAEDSVYRQKGAERYGQVKKSFVRTHLDAARRSKNGGKCEEARQHVEAVLTVDESNAEAADVIKSCGSSIKPAVAKDPGAVKPTKPEHVSSTPKQKEKEPATESEPKSSANDNVAAEKVLLDARDAYVHGQYANAIEIAKKAVKAQPNQAWRLIGASSCFLKDRNGAVQAWNKLDTQGRSFLKYVCSRNAITVP
jgi:pSer/pThr/pTyr-binding forkhead associated (FHA) protein/tetratricopeptide (TPR) repeat protein